MTFAHDEFDAGAAIHEHDHPEKEVWIGDVAHLAGPGCVAVVPAHARRRVMALTRGCAIIVDHPARAGFAET
jgi:quercetin dioxygenase-like cupin family protein